MKIGFVNRLRDLTWIYSNFFLVSLMWHSRRPICSCACRRGLSRGFVTPWNADISSPGFHPHDDLMWKAKGIRSESGEQVAMPVGKMLAELDGPQILTIWPFAKTNFTNEPWPKFILEVTLLFSTKLYGAEFRHLSVTSTDVECRATADGRLSRRANVHSAPCYLVLRCLNSASYDLTLNRKVIF